MDSTPNALEMVLIHWGFKFKINGTAKITLDELKTIVHTFCPPKTFIMDSGSHFNNGDVHAWCEAQNTTHHIVVAYISCINELVENANGKLLDHPK